MTEMMMWNAEAFSADYEQFMADIEALNEEEAEMTPSAPTDEEMEAMARYYGEA